MARRLSRLFYWRCLRWGVALPALGAALWSCSSYPLTQPSPVAQQQTDIVIAINPERMIDILFVIDNSPSMEEEQASLAENFPRMIDELKKLPMGLPDVHIAVVSSDMGAGWSTFGNCRQLGDRGLFQTKRKMTTECGLNPGALWIEQLQGNPPQVNFTGDISKVFACMASLGTTGCGYEHQLQALRVALSTATRKEHTGFLRENAYLAIIIISDEDDCSATPDSPMFEQALDSETASLRCATRGHTCNGQSLPFPTTGGFEASLASCEAKDSAEVERLPLIRVEEFVRSVRDVKPRPQEQVFVAGIFGWPLPEDVATARYRIGKDLTNPENMSVLWDYLPICNVPGLGKAYAGLRLKAFVDAFGENGWPFSLCAGDFSSAMREIGERIFERIRESCVSYPLIDTDASVPGVQPECQVFDSVPVGARSNLDPIVPCETAGRSLPCWRLVDDARACPGLGQMIDVERAKDAAGNTIKPPSGTQLIMNCLTCARPDGNCPAMP